MSQNPEINKVKMPEKIVAEERAKESGYTARLLFDFPSLRTALVFLSEQEPSVFLSSSSGQDTFRSRFLLHRCLHYVLLHPYLDLDRRGGGEWDLWMDLSAESWILHRLRKEKLRRKYELPGDEKRRRILAGFCGERISEEEFLVWFDGHRDRPDFSDVKSLFTFDDHRTFRRKKMNISASEEAFWNRISFAALSEEEGHSHRFGSQIGADREKIEVLNQGIYDFRDYLRQFMSRKEVRRPDPDSYDPIAYSYGLSAGCCLLEPLETREEKRLSALCVAIDTSHSCSRAQVQRFLEETRTLILSENLFFQEFEVWILQCDCVIQEKICIHSEAEWNRYEQHLEINGRGGTDFTPVFRWIEQENRDREQEGRTDLIRALLYFTDGEGVYPTVKPHFRCAFVFPSAVPAYETVPNWADILILDEA